MRIVWFYWSAFGGVNFFQITIHLSKQKWIFSLSDGALLLKSFVFYEQNWFYGAFNHYSPVIDLNRVCGKMNTYTFSMTTSIIETYIEKKKKSKNLKYQLLALTTQNRLIERKSIFNFHRKYGINNATGSDIISQTLKANNKHNQEGFCRQTKTNQIKISISCLCQGQSSYIS